MQDTFTLYLDVFMPGLWPGGSSVKLSRLLKTDLVEAGEGYVELALTTEVTIYPQPGYEGCNEDGEKYYYSAMHGKDVFVSEGNEDSFLAEAEKVGWDVSRARQQILEVREGKKKTGQIVGYEDDVYPATSKDPASFGIGGTILLSVMTLFMLAAIFVPIFSTLHENCSF